MGFVKEPKGIDFVINSGVLSDFDREEISQFIKKYRLKTTTKNGKRNYNKHEVCTTNQIIMTN
jgi:hypothetical protein